MSPARWVERERVRLGEREGAEGFQDAPGRLQDEGPDARPVPRGRRRRRRRRRPYADIVRRYYPTYPMEEVANAE